MKACNCFAEAHKQQLGLFLLKIIELWNGLC